MTTLCGIGICILLIWAARGVINPSKFKLSVCPGRSNHLTFLHIVAIFLAALLGGPLIAMAIGLYVELTVIQLGIVAGMAMQLVALFGGLVMATYCFDGGAMRGMGFTKRRWINDSIRSVIGFLAILPLSVLILLLTTELILRWNPDLLTPHQFLEILKSPDASTFWRAMIVLTAVVLAPLGEEIFFRGLLQSMFRRYLRRPWWAIIVTSILFSAVHFPVIQSLPALFTLSLALGYNYERTGRLYSPIMIHMLFNLIMIAEALTTGS